MISPSPKLCETVASLRSTLKNRGRIGFVPTMGNLHERHIQLMRQAQQLSDVVVASVFVNRLQFAPHEDFDRYPRTLANDMQLMAEAGVDVVFAPSEAELYPEPQTCLVDPGPIATGLEGEFRPGFFRGVATVVSKLFHIVEPDVAVFGKKDYQQLQVIRHMVRQLQLRVNIIAGETARAHDGLALSSRNGYLSEREREEAPRLYRTLRTCAQGLRDRSASIENLELHAVANLRQNRWRPDYVRICDQTTLAPATDATRHLVILAAAHLGQTRLIDNLEVDR
ncbi:MAG TPA: pantoate--beta-alanine ligase [Pseudomonadota bacterium]|nr:pantoate--beta-alanine ligase [Pseudomonadota bacterium]